ncbi:hypothetical protein CGMCC3_g2512 [Colletotrichum fructicola]|nr:uncharacterized protein CGMCC3_g2512 [Colletotrichum fructicola]KAE9581424.1 hypothetical protein CGMCC3_g2512 [Colletotrichum fructicola]
MNTGSEGGINGIFFIDQTISRDVNERREEAGLLPRLNSKFDSLTLRLNSSQKPNQPAEESKVTSEFGRMFSGVGKGAPRIGDPGSVTAVAQQPYTDMNTGLALRGETDGLGLEPPRALASTDTTPSHEIKAPEYQARCTLVTELEGAAVPKEEVTLLDCEIIKKF